VRAYIARLAGGTYRADLVVTTGDRPGLALFDSHGQASTRRARGRRDERRPRGTGQGEVSTYGHGHGHRRARAVGQQRN
jgi:hypothetical protein